MKVKDRKILVTLKEIYNAKYFKYSVFENSFIYETSSSEVLSVTFASLLNTLDKKHEIYSLLDEVNSSYFPRRLNETITSFYKHHNLKLPKYIYISELGFEIFFHDRIEFIEYHDDFSIFLTEFAKLYEVEDEDFPIDIDSKTYMGAYHK